MFEELAAAIDRDTVHGGKSIEYLWQERRSRCYMSVRKAICLVSQLYVIQLFRATIHSIMSGCAKLRNPALKLMISFELLYICIII